jgi:excisionase family DNA binding protein
LSLEPAAVSANALLGLGRDAPQSAEAGDFASEVRRLADDLLSSELDTEQIQNRLKALDQIAQCHSPTGPPQTGRRRTKTRRPQGGAGRRTTPNPIFADLADRFLSREEAAAYLGLTVSALAHDVVHGRLGIPRHKFGLSVRYRRSELDRWAESRRAGGGAS